MSTILHYTLGDAEEWAAFSGDYNPVHFDRQFAHDMGLAELSVHGMRAMLDVKPPLTAALLADKPEADFFAFSTRLRRPLLCQTPYRLRLVAAPGHLVARLEDPVTEDCCLTSKLAPALPPALMACERQQRIPAEEMVAFSRKFPGDVSDPRQAWSFLDALLFHLLLKSPESLVALAAVLPLLKGVTLTEVFSRLPVMQTHHETHFSARLLHDPLLLHQPLFWAIQPALVMGDKENGFVLRTVIQARTPLPLMTTAVTLKTWPVKDN